MSPKIQMTARISGTRDGQDWPARGGIINVPKGEADDLIRAGLAVAHSGTKTTETATDKTSTEKATVSDPASAPAGYQTLKAELKKRGLPTDGKTDVLAARLKAALEAAPAETPPADDGAPTSTDDDASPTAGEPAQTD